MPDRVRIWRLEHTDTDWPPAQTLKPGKPHAQGSLIIRFLKRGSIYALDMSPIKNPFSPHEKLKCRTGMLSDGVWLWPLEAWYYVLRYHVDVPPDFVDHMQRSDWQPPRMTGLDRREIHDFLIRNVPEFARRIAASTGF